MKIVLAQINPTIGDLSGNLKKILRGIEFAKDQEAGLVVFPELALTGYPPDDFLLLPHFIAALKHPLEQIREASLGIDVVVGMPRLSEAKTEKRLHNSAAIFSDARFLGYQDKSLLPTYDVFDERRYFSPSTGTHTWDLGGKKVAITICEDIWQHSELLPYAYYLNDPIIELQNEKPELMINLSASPYSLKKLNKRLEACSKSAKALHCPVVLCNQVGGNDSLIFDGNSLYVNSSGQLIQKAKAFEEDLLLIDLDAHLSPKQLKEDTLVSLYQALVLGLKDYFQKSGFKTACLGLSGGIDSALVACIAVEALGKENVFAFSMPSHYSSPGSVTDAKELAQKLGISFEVIPINALFNDYKQLLQPFFKGKPEDITEENLQARIRGTILMALSNKHGYIVLSTGNKSELAMGYATLYGDLCGGLAILNDVSKKQVYALVNWINKKEEVIPKAIIAKPPSAELKPDQKDSDTLPPYDIIDNVLEAYVEEHLSPEEIVKKYQYPQELVDSLIKKIHCSEYKRRQSPPGLRITEKSFTIGRRFPIVQKWI